MTSRTDSLRALYAGLAADPVARFLNTQHLLLLEALCDGSTNLYAASEAINLSYAQTTRLVTRMVEIGVLKREWDNKASRPTVVVTRKGRALQERVVELLTAQQRTETP